jgi:hypothetical protein
VTADTIIEQLTGDTIVSQIIELVSQAWKLEQRDAHGRWTGGGGGASHTAERKARLAAVQSRNMATGIAAHAEAQAQVERLVAERIQTSVENKAAEVLAATDKKLESQFRQWEHTEDVKHKKKLVTELLVAALGGLISYISLKAGLPEAGVAATGMIPFILQPVIEFLRKI